jgi:mono/diheme cytochrome c family protein
MARMLVPTLVTFVAVGLAGCAETLSFMPWEDEEPSATEQVATPAPAEPSNADLVAASTAAQPGQTEEAAGQPLTEEQLVAKGKSIAQTRCGSCHSVGPSGKSPVAGTTPLRKFRRDWTNAELREALSTGVISDHDEADPKVPSIKLSEAEIDALLAYAKAISAHNTRVPRSW